MAKKIQCRLMAWERTPPAMTPTDAPAEPTKVRTPIALDRSKAVAKRARRDEGPLAAGHLGLCQVHWQRVQQNAVLARRDADLLQGRRHLCREDMPGVLQKAGEIRGGAAAVSGVKERV
ncbi:hypothetical protein [Actinacidiphila oryziradicis]|uniref:Uncharacterized protein n=1 Tax=Actinacidiphila oryziradicis TaxID=2571141 RepID=A0A4U0S0H5_9ACTN|nr:hypothetical protein [Actinacidiphila oryziradicis]TKA01437.1 hypothetical protein FCI23_40530 [Actinacidiphila oryziradicis]